MDCWIVGWPAFSRQVGIRRDRMDDCSVIFFEIKVEVKVEIC